MAGTDNREVGKNPVRVWRELSQKDPKLSKEEI